MLKELIEEYKKTKIKRIKDRNNMAYKFESGKIINLADLEKREISKGAIFDYYKHKHFLNNFNKETQAFLFITFTLNPKHNKKEHDDNLETLKNQNLLFEEYFSTITKHNKTEYIKIKELTKKGNIHLHTLFKMEKENIGNFIRTMEKAKGENIGIINIKTEKGIIPDHKYYNLHSFQSYNKKENEYIEKRAIIKSNLNDIERENTIKSGVFIEIDELEQFEADNVKNYILKYIKKNMDTNFNNESNEHIIFKIADIRKLTTSQMMKKESKGDFLNYYYFYINYFKQNGENIGKDLKTIDFIEKYENKELFEEWKEWKENNKKERPELLNLKDKKHLEEYLYFQVNQIEDKQERETIKTIAIKNVICNLDEYMNKKLDIQEVIKEEYIIQKELHDERELTGYYKRENELYELYFRQWLKEHKIGIKQYQKMTDEEIMEKINARSKVRKYRKKGIEILF